MNTFCTTIPTSFHNLLNLFVYILYHDYTAGKVEGIACVYARIHCMYTELYKPAYYRRRGFLSACAYHENSKKLPYSGKISRVLIFTVFADRRQTAKFVTSKNNE